MKRNSGFTLLEIMISVAIILILCVLLIGGMTSMVANQRFSTATDRVMSTLNLARSLAITHNAIYHVRVANYQPLTDASNNIIIDTTTGKPVPDFDHQVIGIYCYPRANDALSVQKIDRVSGQPAGGVAEFNWSPRSTIVDPPLPAPAVNLKNYRVAYEPLEKGTYFGIQASSSAVVPDDSILYFLPDGTASGSMTLYVTNDVQLQDNPNDSAWGWKDRNDVRRAINTGTLATYTPATADPTATSVSGKLTSKTAVNFIQVFQGGMIRFVQERSVK